MTLKKCPQCARAIPESAAVCDHCGHAPDDTATATAQDAVEAPEAPAQVTPERRTVSVGELMILLAGVAGSALIVFMLLSARGAASPAAHVPAGAPVAPPRPKAAAPVATPLAAPAWTTANSTQWVGNARKAVAFEVAAADKVQVWMRQVVPLLVVRCVAGTTDVFVFTDSAARMEVQDEDHTVRLRFDEEAETTERWPDSEAHDALFAPDGPAFARRLAAARTLAFSFTPHNANTVTARFDVTGLTEAMAKTKGACR